MCERDTVHQPKTEGKKDDTETNLTCVVKAENEVVLLKTALASMSDIEGNWIGKGRILFDDASTKSYITKELFEKLNLQPISNRRVVIRGACATSTVTDCKIVQLRVQTLEPRVQVCITASVLDDICEPLHDQKITITRDAYPHLRGITLADQGEDEFTKKVDVLIGADFYYEFLTGVVKKQTHGRGPVAILTKIGWVLGGPVIRQSSKNVLTNLAVDRTLKCTEKGFVNRVTDPLIEKITEFWNIESLGIRENEKSDEYSNFTDSLVYDAGGKRYEVGLPWKDGYFLLPDNYANSERRIRSSILKMKRDPNLLRDYDNIIKDQLQQGIIESCDREYSSNEPIHYLPHRGVVRENRPSTKLRIVYDASSKAGKHLPSLNECLLKGPSLNPLIIEIMLRFRLHNIAFVCEIIIKLTAHLQCKNLRNVNA